MNYTTRPSVYNRRQSFAFIHGSVWSTNTRQIYLPPSLPISVRYRCQCTHAARSDWRHQRATARCREVAPLMTSSLRRRAIDGQPCEAMSCRVPTTPACRSSACVWASASRSQPIMQQISSSAVNHVKYLAVSSLSSSLAETLKLFILLRKTCNEVSK